MVDDFYWRHARDSLLTKNALRMFQLVAANEGKVFDTVKQDIDKDYRAAVGSEAISRHGGIIQTQFQVFREAGWVTLDASTDPAGVIRLTPAGKQALLLLTKVPDFLKAAPFFLVELLARFQLNNPARPSLKKNPEYEARLANATVFPYWTLFKVMRSLNGCVTASELRRFVFKIKSQSEVESTIAKIREYRQSVAQGLSDEKLDERYPKELEGANGEPKYLMGRLGTQVGIDPPVVEKEGASKWKLNRYYEPFIDAILANEPQFKDELTETTWTQEYGKPVPIDSEESSPLPGEEYSTDRAQLPKDLPDDDAVWIAVSELIAEGSGSVLLSGPPGTSKTWYARQLAGKLTNGDSTRVRFVQFHPSMSYDDFVEGYVPNIVDGRSTFEIRKKLFLTLCDVAESRKPELCILVIDEVNRGDVGRIFGELLTYIEPSYRGHSFQLAYSGRSAKIPSNLFLIGTYNPFDKSVVDLDDAFDRRFDRISLEPSVERLRKLLSQASVPEALIGRVTSFFVHINSKSRHGIGHALFLSIKDDDSLRRLWNRKLRFILEKSFRFEPEAMNAAKQSYLALFDNADSAGI